MLLIAVIIIVLILIICILRRRKTPSQLLDESNGTFDEAAEMALDIIDNKADKTAEDYVNRAEINRYNRLDGVIVSPQVAVTVADDYARGLAAMAPTDTRVPFVATRIRDMADVTRTAARDLAAHDLMDEYEILQMMNIANVADDVGATAETTASVSRMEMSRRRSSTRAAAADLYLRPTWTDDRQNVHDTQVNRDLRATLDRLDGAKDIKRAFDECRKAGGNRTVLERMAEGGAVTALKTTESKVFARVWERASHPKNNEKDVKQAIIRALDDCVEDGGIVCANGRCGRVIGALANIDHDPLVGHIGTFEMYKNNAIRDSRAIIDAELKKMPEDRVKAWNAGDDAPDVVERLKAAISANIDTYVDKVSDANLKVMRDICMQSVE